MTATLTRAEVRNARAARAPRAVFPRWTPAVLLALAIVAWLIVLPSLHDAAWNVFGLVAAAGPLFVVSIALVALAFCLAIAVDARRTAGAALIATVLMMRLPTAVSVDAPLYSWTYKHFGVIDYIQRHGVVAQDVDIYHNWPGAFSLFAWINTITGSETIAIAQWFAIAAQLLLVGAVYLLARSLGMAANTSMVAAFLAQAANWVGQDYLSPQAIAFTLGIVVIGLVLASQRSRAAVWVAVPIFAAIVVTHQLTPYWLIALIAVLTVLGYVRPRWVVLVFAAIAIGYALMHLPILGRFGNLLDFNFLANLQTNTARIASEPSFGQVVSSLAARTVTAVLWLGTAAVVVWRLVKRRDARRETLAAAAVAFSSVLILVGQGYGGEAIFRVFLYSLPGCALILAPVLVAALRGTIPRLRTTGTLGATVAITLVTVLSTQAYYGGWFANLVTKDSIAIATRILEDESPSTLTIGVAPGAPGRLVGEYVDFVRANRDFDIGIDTWLNAWPGWQGEDFAEPDRMRRLTDGLISAQRPAVVVVTAQMRYYSEYYGTFPAGSLDRFTGLLLDDPRWVLTTDTAEMLVFELDLEGGWIE